MKTGSVAQDLLRAGFQITCRSGLEHLFKIDEKTIESCKEFKKRHVKEVAEKISDTKWLEYRIGATDFNKTIPIKVGLFGIPWLFPREQKLRKYDIVSVFIDDDERYNLNIKEGVYYTKVHIHYVAHKWKGFLYEWGKLKRNTFLKVEEIKDAYITTKGKRCKLLFSPYNTYTERYIPDEMVDTIKIAIELGMEDIEIVSPIVEDVLDVDPIVIGYFNKTMYMIGWFGYDEKNPMACNI